MIWEIRSDMELRIYQSTWGLGVVFLCFLLGSVTSVILQEEEKKKDVPSFGCGIG
jgi:hypothetical protein